LRKPVQAYAQHLPESRRIDVLVFVDRFSFRDHCIRAGCFAPARPVNVGDLVLQDADRVGLERRFPAKTIRSRKHCRQRLLCGILGCVTVAQAAPRIGDQAAPQLAKSLGI
jgi:hypothetical protein